VSAWNLIGVIDDTFRAIMLGLRRPIPLRSRSRILHRLLNRIRPRLLLFVVLHLQDRRYVRVEQTLRLLFRINLTLLGRHVFDRGGLRLGRNVLSLRNGVSLLVVGVDNILETLRLFSFRCVRWHVHHILNPSFGVDDALNGSTRGGVLLQVDVLRGVVLLLGDAVVGDVLDILVLLVGILQVEGLLLVVVLLRGRLVLLNGWCVLLGWHVLDILRLLSCIVGRCFHRQKSVISWRTRKCFLWYCLRRFQVVPLDVLQTDFRVLGHDRRQHATNYHEVSLQQDGCCNRYNFLLGRVEMHPERN
jgi:hypothetical protein